MALTKEQQDEIVRRLRNKEIPRDIIESMGIERKEFHSFRRLHSDEQGRLINREARLEGLRMRKARLQERMDMVDRLIAELE